MKNKPLTALQSKAESHWTRSTPRAPPRWSQASGCLRWKRQAGSVCFPLSSLQTLPLSRSEDRFGWQPPGIWGYNTNYDREASIRKTSVSLPVKLSCVAAWLEPSYLFLMLPLERRVRLVCLATKMILKLPSSWKSMGFFESALLEALGMKGVPYY